MRKVFFVVLAFIFVIVVGCGNKNKQSTTQLIPEITKAEAKVKLDEMSKGLDVYYDDMKGFTICRCNYATDYSSVIVPAVIVLDDFKVSLVYHVLYSGREPLRFDTLYVKTVDGVKSFKFDKVSTLYGHVVVEEYKGNMSDEVYKTLKTAVSAGYAKIRLEGRQMDERELTQEELSEYAKVFSIYEFFSNVKVK